MPTAATANAQPFPNVLGALNLGAQDTLAVYNALAQWADNERNGVEEADTPYNESEQRELKSRIEHVAAVETVVARLETVLFGA